MKEFRLPAKDYRLPTAKHCRMRAEGYLCCMDQLIQQIAAYRQEIESLATNGAESLEAYRIKFLGTKGIVKTFLPR
jgi:hypothetical protein